MHDEWADEPYSMMAPVYTNVHVVEDLFGWNGARSLSITPEDVLVDGHLSMMYDVRRGSILIQFVSPYYASSMIKLPESWTLV